MTGILLRTMQLKSEMTKMEKGVADALLSEPNAIVTRSITEYAQYISSSTATITRFCKRLGISGFSELRLSVAKSLTDGMSNVVVGDFVNLDTVKSTDEIVDAVFNNALSSIDQLRRTVSVVSVEKAAGIIAGARNVLLSGIGASGLVALDLHQKLSRVGVLSHYDSDHDLQKVQLSSFDGRDVVVAFSYSGRKTEVRELCQLAKEKKVTVIAVVKQGTNPIGELADLVINVVPSEALVREGATVSRLQMLLVVDLLYQCIIQRESNVFVKLMDSWASVKK